MSRKIIWGLAIIFITILLCCCNNRVSDIYAIYPKGKELSKEDLQYIYALYFIDNENLAMKVDLGQMRNMDYYMPHILFFDSVLTLKSASYFPFIVDSLKDHTFYCKYTDKDWAKRLDDFRHDIPSHIEISSSYRGHELTSNGDFNLSLVLKEINLDEFPIISLIVDGAYTTDTLRAPCDRFEFNLWRTKSPLGITGQISIRHKEDLFPSKYKNNKHINIDIYEIELIDKFYDDLWSHLRGRQRR